MNRRVALAALAISICGVFCNSVSADPQTPFTGVLTFETLVGHPERWPDQVTANIDMAMSDGSVLHSGQKYTFYSLDSSGVVLGDGAGKHFRATPEQCNIIAAATAFWTSLTEQQRSVTFEQVKADPTLWPDQVTLRDMITLPGAGDIHEGTALKLMNLKDDIATVKPLTNASAPLCQLPFYETDLMDRARVIAAMPEDIRPSRIVAQLQGKTVDANGNPVDCPDKGVKYLVLYFGASWCGPCRAFSPQLVKFHDEFAAAHPEAAFILMSQDHDDGGMIQYMADEHIAWPALKPIDAQSSSLYGYLSGPGIPSLVVIDRRGKIIFDSWKDGKYLGPQIPLNQLKQLLLAPAPATRPASASTAISVEAQKAEKDCKAWLGLARNYAANGMKDKAVEFYQKVIDTHGSTPIVQTARKELNDLASSQKEGQLSIPKDASTGDNASPDHAESK